jgi:hypothetical protein
MIRLSDRDVAEFRDLYRQQTGKELSAAQARDYAERLVRLVAFAAGMDPAPPP